MMGNAIRAGRAYIELFLNRRQFDQGLAQLGMTMKNFGSSMQAIGKNMFLGGAASAGLFGVAANEFRKFEQAMAGVGAVGQLTAEQMDQVTQKALEMGRTTRFSATEAANAMLVFARAGFDTQEMIEGIGPTLTLAEAGMLDIASATDIAVGVLKGSQLPVSELNRVVDVLAKAAVSTNTDIRGLGDAFKYVGPLGSMMGASVEEVTAMIQLLSDKMIRGEMAGTSIRGIWLQLADLPREAAKALDELGIVVQDTNGDMLSMVEIIEQAEQAFQGLGRREIMGRVAQIFNQRQAAGFAALVQSGSERLQQTIIELNNAAGTAERIGKRQMDTLNGDLIILKSNLEGLAITIGTAVRQEMRSLVKLVTEAVKEFNAWIEANPHFVRSWGLVTAGVLAAGAALVALGLSITALGTVVGGLATALSAVGFTLGAVFTTGGTIGAAIAGVTAFNVVALNSTGEIQKAFKDLGSEIGDVFKGWDKVWSAFTESLKAGRVKQALDALGIGIRMTFNNTIIKIEEDFWRWLPGFFERIIKAWEDHMAIHGWRLPHAIFKRLHDMVPGRDIFPMRRWIRDGLNDFEKFMKDMDPNKGNKKNWLERFMDGEMAEAAKQANREWAKAIENIRLDAFFKENDPQKIAKDFMQMGKEHGLQVKTFQRKVKAQKEEVQQQEKIVDLMRATGQLRKHQSFERYQATMRSSGTFVGAAVSRLTATSRSAGMTEIDYLKEIENNTGQMAAAQEAADRENVRRLDEQIRLMAVAANAAVGVRLL